MVSYLKLLINIREICEVCPNRVIAVAFGCEDFVTNLEGVHDSDGISIFSARSIIAMGARSCGIVPIDTVHIKVHDLEDLEKNIILAKKLGFEGMLVLNPKELPLVHKYYSPSEEEILWAEEILSLYDEAELSGVGVSIKNGKFIGPPMVKKANKIIEKSKRTNLL